MNVYLNECFVSDTDDWGHPCQILADFMTLSEKGCDLRNLKFAFVGDTNNNVTYDIMRAAAILGMDMRVGGPDLPHYKVDASVIEWCNEMNKTSGGKLLITHDAKAAVDGADVVYGDSWMSYSIAKEEEAHRISELEAYRINTELMSHTNNGFFMHCLPALRGMEVTADVIDGPRSIVFDEAENRLHAQKALLLYVLRLV
jgi:ornithine carbamoyltransferase